MEMNAEKTKGNLKETVPRTDCARANAIGGSGIFQQFG
jgi:hypothetical protein